jgi:protein O-GlcNAc transferase
MNRAEKRRQQKSAKKAAKSAKSVQSANPSLDQQTLTIPQAIDFAMQHHTSGRLPQAESIYQQILQADPSQPVALHLLGVIAHQVGKNDIAVDLITKALAIKPDFAEALSNLGLALEYLNKLDEAVANYNKALAIKPNFAEAHYNLGNALKDLGKLDEAVASYNKALAIKPNFAEAHYNLGNALKDLGKLDEAVASHNKALTIKPNFAEAHYNLGNVLRELGRQEEAVASYHKCLAIRPDDFSAYSNLLCAFKFMAKKPSSEIKVEAEKFGEIARAKADPFSNWNVLSSPEKQLRVGIVSGDLRNHVVARLLMSVLENIDKSRVKFVAYSNSPVDDQMTARLKLHFARWCMVEMLSDDRLAGLIHDDAIDILIDLSGHSALNRLPMFAYKPAPVQATWLGLFATTGVPGMDYIISDTHIAPNHEAEFFTEELWCLAESWFCAAPPAIEIAPASLPALDNGYVTFGCFNNPAKINDAVVALWARILLELTSSRLFLKTVKNDSEKRNISARFAAHGIDPERLILEGMSPHEEYFAAYNRVDITLDPFPYAGGMTSLDSLWMAVPVLTRRGERVGSHLGESIAHNAGLAEWIAEDDESYVAKAVAHSSDLRQLAELRAGLRQQVLATSLFDGLRFAGHFENALRGMWRKRLEGWSL